MIFFSPDFLYAFLKESGILLKKIKALGKQTLHISFYITFLLLFSSILKCVKSEKQYNSLMFQLHIWVVLQSVNTSIFILVYNLYRQLYVGLGCSIRTYHRYRQKCLSVHVMHLMLYCHTDLNLLYLDQSEYLTSCGRFELPVQHLIGVW